MSIPPPPSPRRAGLRLAIAGGITLVAGVLLIAFVDSTTDRALSYPEIGAKPSFGVQLLAGLPATIGYVLGALGLYRLLTNRGPGDESQAPMAVVGRVVLGGVLAVVFFAGAYGITVLLRMR